MLKRSRLMWVAGAFVALAAGMGACGSSGTGTSGTSNPGCTPGTTQECACLGGTKGVQSCKDDGKSFGEGRVGDDSSPNGAINSIAGVFNERFNVLGLMPHPENLIDPLVGGTDGRALFASLAA